MEWVGRASGTGQGVAPLESGETCSESLEADRVSWLQANIPLCPPRVAGPPGTLSPQTFNRIQPLRGEQGLEGPPGTLPLVPLLGDGHSDGIEPPALAQIKKSAKMHIFSLLPPILSLSSLALPLSREIKAPTSHGQERGLVGQGAEAWGSGETSREAAPAKGKLPEVLPASI